MKNANAYAKAEKSVLQGADLEASILIKCASELNYIKENWEQEKGRLDDILERNRKLWTILSTSVLEEDSPHSITIKNSISNLALFVFQRTLDILIKPNPDSLKILIDINMNIAKGLNGNAE